MLVRRLSSKNFSRISVRFIHNNISSELQLPKELQLSKELQLLKAIYSKKKLNDLTETFCVTYNTLRTHLQAIFRKTLVNSQTELMMKLNMFKS